MSVFKRAEGGSRARQEERLSDEQVEALSRYGMELRLGVGDLLFDENSIVDSFFVVLEGEIRISRLDGAAETPLVSHHPGEFTGELAILTGNRSIHRARAAVPSRVLEIDAETFRRVTFEVPEAADVFVSALGRRMRQTQRALRQQEKLAALGRLSAGLAHELNNPAAAARRAVRELRETSLAAQDTALRHDGRFSPAQRETLLALRREGVEAGPASGSDPLEQSDREEELARWLEERDVEEAWDLAPPLATAGLDAGKLEALEDKFDAETLAGGLEWLGSALEVAGLAEEVEESAGRISELVAAIKEHTQMDRSPELRATDVREGIESTLTIIGHRLRGMSVRREYEEGLPKVVARGGELNQVWANLIDNAADAVSRRDGVGGTLGIRAGRDDPDRVVVEVRDDGPGIPPEARGRIFEPFFTTKDVGEGTGLGLDLVRRVVVGHGGEIDFQSRPGDTRFRVRLPVTQEKGETR